jgi:hypothetical protein
LFPQNAIPTPPAFAALPGPNTIFDCRKTSIASLVQGIFAPASNQQHITKEHHKEGAYQSSGNTICQKQ